MDEKEAQKENSREKMNIPFSAIVIIILFVFGLCALISRLSNSKTTSNDRRIDAWVCAQNVVTESLYAPSTADFPTYSSSYVTRIEGNKYSITAYVDAQNMFGSTTRQYFTVTLTLTKSGYKEASLHFS